VVDAHTHVGIYAPLRDDAVTESQAAVTGGVTTALTYVRTGQYYLDRGGPYGRRQRGQPAQDDRRAARGGAGPRALPFVSGLIHSHPQDFPYPQPTHILGITSRGAPTPGGHIANAGGRKSTC